MTFSIIIPVFNEADSIDQYLRQLTPISDCDIEIIVVDGGSSDNTVDLVSKHSVTLIHSAKGRATQMNAGAAVASGNVLLFVHGDTKFSAIKEQLANIRAIASEYPWGFFKIKLSGRHWMYRIIETMMNIRSRATRIATGDQCIFVSRALFDKLEGYKDIPLMEDVELSKRLRQRARPYIVQQKVITSSRRWEKKGIVSTVLLMWRLRFLFFIGVPPKCLVKHYSS